MSASGKHEHAWDVFAYGVAKGTRGNGGRGRTVAMARRCKVCGRVERRRYTTPGSGLPVKYRSRWAKADA